MSNAMCFQSPQKVLQELFGLSLTWDRSFQVYVILYGSENSGVDLTFNMWKLLNSGAYCSVPYDKLTLPDSQKKLTENRVNFGTIPNGHLSEHRVWEIDAILNRCACGEPLSVRTHDGLELRHFSALNVFLMRPPFRKELFKDSWTTRHRLRIIPYTTMFSKNSQEIEEKAMQNELPGIMNWALAGYHSVLQNGRVSFCAEGRKIIQDNFGLDSTEEAK